MRFLKMAFGALVITIAVACSNTPEKETVIIEKEQPVVEKDNTAPEEESSNLEFKVGSKDGKIDAEVEGKVD